MMSSSLAFKAVKIARSPLLFTRFRPTSPAVTPLVGLKKRTFTAPGLVLHAGGPTSPSCALGHRNFSSKVKKIQSLPSSDEDEDIHVKFISDSGEDEDDDVSDDDEEDGYSSGRSPSLYAEVFNPYMHKSSFGQLLQYIDLLKEENQALKESHGGVSEYSTSGEMMSYKEDDAALYLWVNMPGLGKEDVKVSVEKSVLTMKGERNDVAGGRKFEYCEKAKLDTAICNVNEIKAEILNGVLKVVVPKMKEEERKDVIRVSVA